MIIRTTILLFLVFAVSYNQPKKNASSQKSFTTTPDSIDDEETFNPYSAEYIRAERKRYVQKYSMVESIDTTFSISGSETVRVQTKYYCLHDNAVLIPGTYVWEDTTAIFQTHNFAHDVKITINGKTLFSRTIKKKDFETISTPKLLKYGVIFSARFQEYHRGYNYFLFTYSLTIPCTDLGSGIALYIDKAGRWIITH